MIPLTNDQFLTEIFGQDKGEVIVASFHGDPGNVPNRGCWTGHYFKHAYIEPLTNQYYCISTFHPADDGKARRRKDLFKTMHLIVADDVPKRQPSLLVLQPPRS